MSKLTIYKQRFADLPGNLKGALTLLVAAAGFSVMVMLVKLAGERLHVTQILLVRQLIMMTIVMPSVLNQFPGCLKTKNSNSLTCSSMHSGSITERLTRTLNS